MSSGLKSAAPGVCAAIAVLCVQCAFGQSATSVRGHITDASSGAVPNAQVHLINTETNAARDTLSSSDGLYEFLQVTPGTYNVTVTARGFAQAERIGVKLLVNFPSTVDFQLQVAGSTQKIEVSASGAPMVNTTDATLGNVFDTQQVEQLPIEARNVVELLSLQPGVVYIGNRVDHDSDTRNGAINGASGSM